MGRTVRPSASDLAAAVSKGTPDLIVPGLGVLFCGINPGLYSAAVGHHFARPGNRFWPALFAAGFTPRLFTGFDDRELLGLGCGLTNLVKRSSARADEVTRDELRAGARSLRKRLARSRPRFLAVVGFGAYRMAFDRPRAVAGPQPERIADTKVWLLPNTSGLNAHHLPAQLARLFEDLRIAAGMARR
ncbi:MAG: G/U mismatch-specific DNA glycosylase [Kofleriaceae bacterium]